MAMNIGEAQAAQDVLKALMGEGVERDRFVKAAETLARSSYKTLHAGRTPDDVRARLGSSMAIGFRFLGVD
jgi:hypothetical protein